MNRSKILNQRKGISPIIATLLLILIAIAAGVVVYAYVLGFMGNSINQNGNGPIAESLSINAWSDNQGGRHNITAYIQNTGQNAITIISFYVYNSSGNLIYTNTTFGSLSISAGQVQKLDIHQGASTALAAGSFYQIKVVTTNGNSAMSNLQRA